MVISMNKEEKEYLDLKSQIELEESKLKLIENLGEVKSYLETKKNIEYLKNLEDSKYTKMRFKEYSNCKHLFVCTSFYKQLEGDTFRDCYSFGCVKCGLNSELGKYCDKNLSRDELINKKYNYFFSVKGRVSLNTVCDLELAMAVYKKIIEVHPYIDEDKIIKYMEIAIDNMRDIPVTYERKQSRIKRLNLNDKFYRW